MTGKPTYGPVPPAPQQAKVTAASVAGPVHVTQRLVAPMPLSYAPAPPPRSAAGGQQLPMNLRGGIESLSGMDMGGVRVHYGSTLPARLNALAYAQGSDIHLAKGQERHLPHEAWHVVQQRMGRVRPTLREGGVSINDNAALEHEADQMGERALRAPPLAFGAMRESAPAGAGWSVAQRVLIDGVDVKPDKKGQNQAILSDALDALIEAQEGGLSDPDSWLSWAAKINAKLQAHGLTVGVKKEIEDFYGQIRELNFKVNPVLREAWQRSLNATSNKLNYAQVGGKFKDKITDVLHEISTDFPALAAKTKKVPVFKVNKEHMINKGKAHGGPPTAHVNLMFAAAPPGGAKETLSEFHKQLHALKPGTGSVNYNALDPDIRDIIEDAQMDYEEDDMGSLS